MDSILINFLAACTIRERSAFTLLVAERAAYALADDPRIAAQIAQALDTAWAWVEAHPITGDQIIEGVLRDDDTGLATATFSDPHAAHGMQAILTALLYVAWHAYGQAGVIAVTDPVNEVGEEQIANIVREALASGHADAALLRAARQALVKSANTSPAVARYYAPHLLGQPISRVKLHGLLSDQAGDPHTS
jgi:hypothetical protein